MRLAWPGKGVAQASLVVAGLVPATPVILLHTLKFGVAGTSPATTPVCDSKAIEIRSKSLIQRLHFDDGAAVIVADPQHRTGAIVDHEDAPDIGVARQQIFNDLV